MFKKLFEFLSYSQPVPATSTPEASKGYHSCVDTCEKDIANLETEIASLKSDNLTLISKVGVLESQNRSLKDERDTFDAELTKLEREASDKDERVEELEARLKEADERADGTPVKYASARKSLSKAKLASLRKALEAAPAGAAGFGGSCSVYDKKTKRVSLVEFKSKAEALDLLDKADKGNVEIIM